MKCAKCGGKGLPNMCPVCYKIGGMNEAHIKFLADCAKRELARMKMEQREIEKRKEVVELWKRATDELWCKNQAAYRELIKVIKRKEVHVLQ